MNSSHLPQTAQEYITCFRQLSAIVSDALDYAESHAPIEPNALEKVSQSVQTIANLRGDSGLFQNSRPAGLVEYQKEMYATEDQLHARLMSLGYTYPTRH